ncbi:MAG: hypothetical protein H7839_01355 [Magnetococcus sp. YQC-5]
MPLSEMMTNDINLMDLGIGLVFIVLALLIFAFARLFPMLRQWHFSAPPPPAPVLIPVLTREAQRRAALKRRQQAFYN